MLHNIRQILAWLVMGLALLCAGEAFAQTAVLLPNGMQQFSDSNGAPYSGGLVYLYVPSTTTPKASWKDPNQSVLNSNPVVLDSAGRAVIFGNGQYREILQDQFGATVWDTLTSTGIASNSVIIGGTSGGTVNAQTVTATGFTSTNGQSISFIAGLTNTSAATLNGLAVVKDTTTGPTALSGGEIFLGNQVTVVYQASTNSWHLMAVPPIISNNTLTNLASASTTDLGTVTSANINITGTTTITSFGTTAKLTAPNYHLVFAGALVLTQSGSLLTPTGANITTAAGDTADVLQMSSGVWRITNYTAATGLALAGSPAVCLASGLKIVNDNTTPNSKIDVTATSATLAAYSGSASGVLRNSISVVINDGVTGANGLDTGAIAANTWYYVWLIDNGTAPAGLLSLSSTAPTLPTGYIYACRFGARNTDGSSLLYREVQRGKQAQYVITGSTNTAAAPTMASGSTSSAWSAVGAGWMPPTANTVRVFTNVANSSGNVGAAPNASYGTGTSGTNPPPIWSGVGGTGYSASLSGELVLESTNIYYWSDNSAASLHAFGWTDSVGAQ